MKLSFGYLFLAVLAAVDAGSVRRKLPSGGSEAASSQIPSFVELKVRNADTRTDRICAGVLIKPDIVATAAACTFAINNEPADASSQALIKGSATNSGAGVSRTWSSYSIHPNYVLGSETDNIALILLSGAVDDIELIDAHRWTTTAGEGTSVTAIGYGDGQKKSGSISLNMASLTVVAEGADGCVTGNSDSVICADSDSQDMCIGDEGSPLINGDKDLVGIYSHGGACDGASGMPKFMRATYYKNFIENQSCALDSEDCRILLSWFGAASMQVASLWTSLLAVFGL